MPSDQNDVVKVFSGTLVDVENYQQVLGAAGIKSKILGTSLLAGFGSAIPGSIELWVRHGDAQKAVAAIERDDKRRGQREPVPACRFPHPTSSGKPTRIPHRREPHIRQDPLGE